MKCRGHISHKIFDNNSVAIRKSKLALKLKNVGMCILELSNVLMYEFHYHYVKKNKSKLLFTDTYSLMYQIKTKDVYEDFCSNKEIFDFSNYSTQSKYYHDSNKSIIRKNEDFALKEIV